MTFDPRQDLRRRARLQGLEMIFVGVLAFAILIGATMGAYRLFILDRVRGSEEFRTASYFATNSPSLRAKLTVPVDELVFRDIEVGGSAGFGVCEIHFELRLEGGTARSLRVGLVRIADFWIVYDAVLDSGRRRETELAGTHGKILLMLEKTDFGELEEARTILQEIRKELRDASLEDYLVARLAGRRGDTAYALKTLEGLASRAGLARPAVLNEQALIHFNRQEFARSIAVLETIEKEHAGPGAGGDGEKAAGGLFEDLPKDPFIAELDPENVLAGARKLLSLAYHDLGDYEKGLYWSEKAIEQAEKIGSSVVRSASVYLKALNLFSLGRDADAESEFSSVIGDPDNPNLAQKAWAYYFRADIAARAGRHEEALDDYEMAVALDPANALVRQGGIEYLMGRGRVGDLEIALGVALRGVDYGVERGLFLDYVSRLYARLGLPDRTNEMK